jgi:micrococcal nuclease
MGLFRILMRAMTASGRSQRSRPPRTLARPIPREMRIAVVQPARPPPPDPVITGRCWVIDGDTIVIDNMHIRLAGIDAPELDHPWGQQSKWALVKLCKGQTVTARIKPEISYDRVVAECFLPDGRDLAAELVKAGLALDWPKFSGGKYRHLEPADARQRLWRAQLRQRGLTPPEGPGRSVLTASRSAGQSSDRPYKAMHPPGRPSQTNYRFGWLMVSGVAVLLVGCNFIGGNADRTISAAPRNQAASFASFEVAASALNVRKEPVASSSVIAQIDRGTTVVPERVSGMWYGIKMPDGTTGWVHSGFLNPVGE